MNKLFKKIAGLSLGLAMAIGVGVAVGSNRDVARVDAAAGDKASGSWTQITSASDINTTDDFLLGWVYNGTPYYSIGTVTSNGVNTSSTITNAVKIRFESATGGYYIKHTSSTYLNNTSSTNMSLGSKSSIWTIDSDLYVVNTSNSNRFLGAASNSATARLKAYASNNKGTYPQVFVYKQSTTYNVSFAVSPAGYGTLSQSSIANVPSGSSISISNNKVTINGTTVTATAASQTAQYTYSFSNWTKSPNNSTVTSAMTITANFTRSTRSYSVGGTIVHGSLSSTANVNYGSALNITINPENGYTYPDSLTSVTMGGSAYAGYTYNNGTGAFSIASVTGAVVINATCPASGNTYSISTTVTNGSYSGDTSITDNGGVASVTISPTGDYKLPTSVSVSGASHTYNATTGVISLSGATGNVTISAAMVALTEYSITVNETNGSHTGASVIKESRTATLTFTPTSGWGQPADVTVSGATKNWVRGTGALTLSNPTGNVTVTYAAVGNELESITLSATSRTYTLGDSFVKPTVTAQYTVAADADVTNSPNLVVTGYDPYTTGTQPVTITYTEGGIQKSASYTATVNAASVITTTTWELTDLADLTSSDEFVIARTSSTTVALPSNGGAAKPTVSSVTISNDKITSTVTDSILWNVTGNASDGYVFNPKGDSTKWLYLLDDANDGVRIGNGNSAANKHFTLEQGYLYSTETTYPRMIGVYNNADWRCYKLTSGGEPGSNIAGQTFGFFKKVKTQTGSADLIRITATYKGGDKYVGDSISTSDFAVKKQLNTGNELIDVASGYTISANTLTAESNSITVSLTEGNITKTAVVVVPATPRAVSLVSVELVQGENVVKEYVDWSGAEWDFTDLSVRRTWSDASTELLDLADLIESEDATVSPEKPAVGVSSFTVSYEYLSVSITNASVTGISIVADYVESVSWADKSLSHFKAFSGEQLTSATVSGWTVKATYAGAGETNALSFGTGANQFTIRIGDSKAVTSLPYTWTTADDNQFVYVVVGGVAKGDSTHAKTNICATINAIDHDEESSGEQTITLDLVGASYTKEGTSGTGSDTEVTISGFTISSDKGYAASESMRVYDGGSFTITSSYEMTNVSVTTTGGKNGLSGGSASGTSYEETADGQARVTTVTITFNGTVTTTTHYANLAEHFDAQKAVVTFAKFMNTTMNGENVCSGTFANLESAWDDVADKYDELFGASTTLNETELAWAKNMLKYATAAWGSDAENACVEKAMKTYEFCIAKHGVDPFMFESDGTTPLRSISSAPSISMLISKNSSAVITIVIISAVSLAAVGGYFLFRKKKEDK